MSVEIIEPNKNVIVTLIFFERCTSIMHSTTYLFLSIGIIVVSKRWIRTPARISGPSHIVQI